MLIRIFFVNFVQNCKIMEFNETLERQIKDRLRNDNIWWSENDIPAYYSDLTPRLYLEVFYPLLVDTSIRRATILMGPRRVGKTVMMFHCIQKLIQDGVSPQNIIYLSVETPIYNGMSLERLLHLSCDILGKDPYSDQLYVFYDEIQYLKDWEVELKTMVDSFHYVKFIASGSAAAALKKSSNESGAGRFTDFYLPPLTFYEFIHLKGYQTLLFPQTLSYGDFALSLYGTIDINRLNELFLDYINYGGYPEVVFSNKIRENPEQFIRHDIIDKVLLRDLPSLYGISDVQELNSLFTVVAYLSGSQLSYEKLAKDSGIKKETLKKYLEYLEAAFLIKLVRRTDSNAKNYQRETQFKIYLTNPSLRCALFMPITEHDQEIGNMVETALFAQMFPRNSSNLRYANWKQGRSEGEVDMVGLSPAKQKPNWAVEIKWTNKFFFKPDELKSLSVFMDTNKLSNSLVTTMTEIGFKEVKENHILCFIPAACYAYVVGKNTIYRTKNDYGL